MAITWDQLSTETISFTNADILKQVYAASYSNGCLIRVDHVFLMALGLQINPISSLIYLPIRKPDQIDWTLQSDDDETNVSGLYTSAGNTKTYTGIPKSTGGNRIGQDVIFLVERTSSINGNALALMSSTLYSTPVTLNQIMYGY